MRRTTGGNNSDLTEMNRSAVVKILQRQEICSRASIARQTGLTQAAITKIIAALMDMGIVTEVGSIKGSGNRRSIGLKLNANRHQVLGVKFAQQMFAVGVFDISGKMYTQTEIEYSIDESPKAVLAAMKAQIHKALEEYESVVAIGVAVPGPYLRTEGRIALVTQMSTWNDINFLEELKEEFDKPVLIEHDAKAGALAEWWFGTHDRQLHTLAYMLVGEGVGSGVIEDGHLLMGVQGVEQAKKAGSLISYDPNLRPPLWKNLEEAKREILSAAALADIIKFSEEEGEFLFGEADSLKICQIVEELFHPAMVVVTLAEQGCTCSIQGKIYQAPAYEANTVDTTGAGDGFWGGVLHGLLQSGKRPEELSDEEVNAILDFSNALGSLVTTRKGAIPAIPTMSEIKQCMQGFRGFRNSSENPGFYQQKG